MIVAHSDLLAFLFIPGVHTEQVERLFEKENRWAVPVSWRLEMHNILAGCVARMKMDWEAARAIMEAVHGLVASTEYVLPSDLVLEMAERSGAPMAACEYAALSADLGAPLVVLDRTLPPLFPGTAVQLDAYLRR